MRRVLSLSLLPLLVCGACGGDGGSSEAGQDAGSGDAGSDPAVGGPDGGAAADEGPHPDAPRDAVGEDAGPDSPWDSADADPELPDVADSFEVAEEAGDALPDETDVAQPDSSGDPEPDAVSDAGDVATEDPPTEAGDLAFDADGSGGAITASSCFAPLHDGGEPLADYDQFDPVINAHCTGTNHQDITGVERVVFAGDSITVGTPPTAFGDWYRNRMAVALADEFGLEPPNFMWQNVDVINGVALAQTSGDFACCAKWGARTDDITNPPHQQLQTCIPESERGKRTLIVMTIGGNDIFSWAQDMQAGTSAEDLWVEVRSAVADMETSVHWAVDDPARFPNGVFVVFANPFEFTDPDSANDFATCPGADLISMDVALVDPELDAMATWMMEQYVRIAVETGTDVIFMGETYCGHGHMNDNPEGRCYRGSGAELWLDITCMHPNGAGHGAIADLFLDVIRE